VFAKGIAKQFAKWFANPIANIRRNAGKRNTLERNA
jgi:hypothetical protein